MRFGVCAGIEQGLAVRGAGGDYLELTVAGDLQPENDETWWAEQRKRILALPLPVEALNVFLGSLQVVGPEVDQTRVTRYVSNTARRAGEIGAGVIVFGSGASRRVPEEFDNALARAQLVWFLRLCADVCAAHSITVAIEPLNRRETNLINTVVEAVEVARDIDREEVRVLADWYHMAQEGESLDSLIAAGRLLAHTHTANADRRSPGSDETDYRVFMDALRRAGYDGRVSTECDWEDEFDERVGSALQTLRRAEL